MLSGLHWKNEAGYHEHSASFRLNILTRKEITSKMAELCVRICCKFLCILYHILNCSVGTISGCVINIDRFDLNVEWRNVSSIKAYDVFPNNIYFLFGHMFQHFADNWLLFRYRWVIIDISLANRTVICDILLHISLQHVQPLEKIFAFGS